jgi:transcriptional regulator with XRE-family HTH domain
LAVDSAVDGQQLRNLIRSSGMTANGVAAQIGVNKNTLSNWSQGHTPIVPEHLTALADALGVSIDELAGRKPGRSAAEEQAITVLSRLVDNAGALRAISQAAPSLLDVLRDAEEALGQRGPRLLPPDPPRASGD